MGRLTKDPELRQTQNGTPVTSFSIAVNRDFKNGNGERETDFVDIVAWRHTAEFACKYFSKGRMIVVDGRLQFRDWTDKNGNKRRSAEILADSLYFGDSKKDSGNTSDYTDSYYSQEPPEYTPNQEFSELSDDEEDPEEFPF
jgi:single-strand DNA-binding protein